MELSLITPVEYLECTRLLPGRFCIAPIALASEEYLRYFQRSAELGYRVILDNGVFENDRVPDKEYIDLARAIKPTVLIAPDTINAPAIGNWTTAVEFAKKVETAELNKVLKRPIELMFVPQCERNDLTGLRVTLEHGIRGGYFQWIGICRDAMCNAFSEVTQTTDQELNRFYFAAWLQLNYVRKEILGKKWHFLGMGKRLYMLQYYWFVSTMDTASLFFQSTLGNEVIVEGILPGELRRPPDYFIRDFGPAVDWLDELSYNCAQALYWGQLADKKRRELLGGRL